MDDLLLRMEGKIDKLDERLDSIDVTLAKQHEQLAIHIKRSDLLEQKIEPVKSKVDMAVGALKLIGLTGVVFAIAEGVISVISFIKGVK